MTKTLFMTYAKFTLCYLFKLTELYRHAVTKHFIELLLCDWHEKGSYCCLFWTNHP